GKIVLVVVCGLGLCLAAAMALRWGSLRVERKPQPASTPAEPTTGNKVVARVRRTLCIGLVGGAVAGLPVGGMGGRLVMRILAATSGPGGQGLRTQAGEAV